MKMKTPMINTQLLALLVMFATFIFLAVLSRTFKDTTETFEDGMCTTCMPQP